MKTVNLVWENWKFLLSLNTYIRWLGKKIYREEQSFTCIYLIIKRTLETKVRLINRSITNHLIDLASIEFIIVASKNRVEWLSPFSRRVPLIKKLSKHDFRAGEAREYLQSERISFCGSWRFYSKVELLNLFSINEKRPPYT